MYTYPHDIGMVSKSPNQTIDVYTNKINVIGYRPFFNMGCRDSRTTLVMSFIVLDCVSYAIFVVEVKAAVPVSSLGTLLPLL